MQKGDIIAIQDDIYIPFPGGAWIDHFVTKRKLYQLCDTPNNNGNVVIRNSQNKEKWFNIYMNRYIIIKKGV